MIYLRKDKDVIFKLSTIPHGDYIEIANPKGIETAEKIIRDYTRLQIQLRSLFYDTKRTM